MQYIYTTTILEDHDSKLICQPVQPVVVVLSLDGTQPSTLIEAEVHLQPVECEGQQSLHGEWREGAAPLTVVQLYAVVDGHCRVLVAHIHTTAYVGWMVELL